MSSFVGETAKRSVQAAIYDFVKFALGTVFGWVATPWLSGKATDMNVPGAMAWALVVVAILVFLGFWLADWWISTRHTPTRRARLLEYHLAHLYWLRDAMVDSDTPPAKVQDGRRVLDKHRQMLLDLTPDVFPQSASVEFQPPRNLHISAHVRELVEGSQEAGTRAAVIAAVDDLMLRVGRVWLAHGGVNAPRP